MSTVNGYEIEGDFSTENAGLSRWAFCRKGGRKYFIKEFLSPVYPDGGKLSPQIVARKKKVCDDFFAEKSLFYKTLERCRTGNNVIIQDFFREGSHFYIVTDIINTISTKPQFVAQLNVEQKLTVIRAILYSVASLHSAGIVHADLKADNVLIKQTQDGFYTAKIIDFDAGFFVHKIPPEVQGDFVYMAPETFLRIQGTEVSMTEKIDIFALGILFHQYWTGELPGFKKEYQYAFEAVLDQSELRVSYRVPDPLRSVLRQMLERVPKNRISATDALKMLEAWSTGNQISAPAGQAKLKFSKGFHRPTDLS